jgi:hypothetical protein
MRRVGLLGAKRQLKRVLAVVGLGVALTAGTVPAQAMTHRHSGGEGSGHKVGGAPKDHKVATAKGHKVG